MPPQPSRPTTAQYPSDLLTIGAGVAIFHLASARVVVCYHTRDEYWFLPKGRRNAGEETRAAAQREGFEESGYRNRVLPLPVRHRQPVPEGADQAVFMVEPLWTQLLPLSTSKQYLLFWFAAETVGKEDERICAEAERGGGGYCAPGAFPDGVSLEERIAVDFEVGEDGAQRVYEPKWHEGTAVDEEEALYRSFLLPIDEARRKLRGSVMEDVVRRAWDGIQLRIDMENELQKGKGVAAET